ncbi:hypothetical protein MOD96_02045 [Bacillus sp. S17B2]|uniref:hypothetical protein n=1 Tax=Bacillus sp. S17B2 TaxID=2918907 RepID=UPI002280EC33|nr:hypothetical protein [Bacillus sp. S17B2]
MDWGNGRGNNVSDRDRLELDDRGRTRQDNTGRQQNHSGVHNYSRGSGKSGSGKLKLALFILMVGGILYIFNMSGKLDLKSFLRTFNSTPEENMAAMTRGIEHLDRANKRDGDPEDPVYDKNNIYSDKDILKMVDKEYIVYVYTRNIEVDKKFNSWVKNNQDDIPVYKLDINSVEYNGEIRKYIDGDKPMLLIFNEVTREEKVLDSVVKDPSLLKNVKLHIQKLIDDKEKRG